MTDIDRDIQTTKEIIGKEKSELVKTYGKVLLKCLIELKELSK